MFRSMMKSKIHGARVTECDLNYRGSITIDEDLMELADLIAHEHVHVLNVNNGARFETYVIAGQRGQRDICLNGAAARLAVPGDRVIVLSYALMSDAEARHQVPRVIMCDIENQPEITGVEDPFTHDRVVIGAASH